MQPGSHFRLSILLNLISLQSSVHGLNCLYVSLVQAQFLLGSFYWPFTSCTSLARRLRLKRAPPPPWPAEEEWASCHGQAGWELGRPAVAQELFPLISTSFICLLPSLFPPPSIHPSILLSCLLFLSLPVDQHSLHAELHCAQSAVAEQMASLCFFTLSEFKCIHMLWSGKYILIPEL